MNASELKEVLRLHALWLSKEEGGQQADLRWANLEGANLEGANLIGAKLHSVDLTGANLTGAILFGVDLSDSILRHAILLDANLSGSDLANTILRNANLTAANLTAANLANASLTDVNLTGSTLVDTNLVNTLLINSNLKDADLTRANLTDSILRYTNLTGANLRNTNLTGAMLEHTNLTNANMAYADLTDAAIYSTDFTGANMTGTILSKIDNVQKISHGRRRKARKALEEVKSPIHVQAFRKMFPNAYSVIQHDFSGTMTPEGAKALLDGYGISWIVNYKTWESSLQRISPKPNDVLRLNVDMNALTSEEKVLDALKAIREVSYRSMHPVVQSSKLMTIGWVRYTVFEKVGIVLIEEVQSDLPTVRKGISEEEFKAELESKGVDDALLHKSLDVLEPFTQRFYEDAMALVFDMAEEKGLVVEMLTHETKEQFGSPKSIYSKLPKAMGMRQTTRVMSPVDVPKVWTIDPTVRANPARKR